ncbi:hypothetical protein Q7C36_006804 [Tachysurus vachellii]|uniref:Uncharacterized protein n=1 Tax=Tachysurus vachellii TaxID=175792 RepID=A0AA88NG63_TACVA|nr:hypothetical protein Q7C36_006804 [Tachysurus vachellii]
MFTTFWTILLKMRLSCVSSVLLMLLFIAVVYSAPLKGENEGFLNFLNEAFNQNSPEPAVITVSGPSNAAGVAEPIAVCSTSSPMDNPTDIADEKSKENSKSSLKKRNKLPYFFRINQSSQETYGTLDSVTDKKRKRRMDTERGREEQLSQKLSETEANFVDIYIPEKLQAKERSRKVYISKESLSDSQNIIDQSQECVEVSSWMMGYPEGENTSVGGAGVQPQSKEGVTNYDGPSKLCAGRKRLRTPRTQREQLDTDSAERVNSELLDQENSNESIPAQTL